MNVAEELRFLAQSANRGQVLLELSESAPLDRTALEQRVDATRRTVVRTLEKFRERGYARETDAGHRLTAFGSILAESYDQFRADVRSADRLRPLLEHLPEGTPDIDPRHLADAELLVATEASPYSILDRTLELRREATRIREVAPAVEKKSVDQLARRVESEENIDVEVVLAESAAEAATETPAYRDPHETAVRSGAVEMFVCADPVPFFLGILDGTVVLGATRDGRPHALLTSTDEAVRDWARRTFEEYRDRATPHTA